MDNLAILYEDKEIIVISKAAGMPVQSKNIAVKDVVSELKNHLGSSYLGVIHRLDQPVRGILVFARTPAAAKALSRSLQQNGFHKIYHALVCGRPARDHDTLEDYMVKDGRTNTSRIVSKDTAGAKAARLNYRLLEYHEDQDYSKLEVQLDTGRHHQIRVQLAALGTPIIGDRKYGMPRPGDEAIDPQLALCACSLTFPHPRTGKEMKFEIKDF